MLRKANNLIYINISNLFLLRSSGSDAITRYKTFVHQKSSHLMTLNVQYLLYLLTILSFDHHYTGLFSFCQSRFLFFSFYLSTFFFFLIQNVLYITNNRMRTLQTFHYHESKKRLFSEPLFHCG